MASNHFHHSLVCPALFRRRSHVDFQHFSVGNSPIATGLRLHEDFDGGCGHLRGIPSNDVLWRRMLDA